jgi:cytidyltransferase-like protein
MAECGRRFLVTANPDIPTMSKALILGSFDILHAGHLETLNYAARLGEVIVGLGTDEYQRIYKHEPVCPYEERALALESLPQVSQVLPRKEIDARPLFEAVRPDYFVAGMDWYGAPHLEMSGIDVDFVNSLGITLVYQPRNHSMSTSAIIERIRATV